MMQVEDVLNVIEKERPEGIIVQFGGQTPLSIAKPLAEALAKNPIPAASGAPRLVNVECPYPSCSLTQLSIAKPLAEALENSIPAASGAALFVCHQAACGGAEPHPGCVRCALPTPFPTAFTPFARHFDTAAQPLS